MKAKMMNRGAGLLVCASLILTAITGCLDRKASGLPKEARRVLAGIKEPSFRNAEYLITDFGAVGDSLTDCREAINSAITLCSDEGGGKVVIPDGKWVCNGCINLKSNVNLHLDDNAELLFSPEPEDYLPGNITVWEGTEFFNYSSPIRAYHCNNVAITGKGTVNGRAKNTFGKMRPQRSAMQDTLRQMGIDQIPVQERCFGKRSIMPPNMIEPFGCKNVLIEGITILDSPYWVIHPLFCDNVIVRDVTIDSHNLNNDGCDPEYTTNVLIEGCRFNTGDDAIAIKAGRDQDAWRIGQKTSNIIIRDCDFSSRCNGLCIGSEMAAGVENVWMHNVHIGVCHSAIYFKSNLDRGGFIRNVWVDGIDCDRVKTALIRFENNYHGGRGGYHPTTFENFSISNVNCKDSGECGFYAVGVEGYPIKNLRLKDIAIDTASKPYIMETVEDVVFDNVTIGGEKLPRVPDTLAGNILHDD